MILNNVTEQYRLWNPSRSRLRLRKGRRGSILIFAVALFTMMIAVSGFSINCAYIELVRSEQRLATDAATKAASLTLARTQSITAARDAAKRIAAYHSVAGSSIVLSDSMIKFGAATRQTNGTYAFTAIANPSSTSVVNAVQINSTLLSRQGGGASTLLFTKLMDSQTPGDSYTHNFSPNISTTVTRMDLDVCLVVDRSGSMAWDLSNSSFSYPASITGSKIQKYVTAPHSTLSRWAVLGRSVNLFLSILDDNVFLPRISLATFSSNFDGQQEDYARYYNSIFRNPSDPPLPQLKSVVATLDQTLTTNYSTVSNRLTAIGQQPLIGDTNVAAGLRLGVNELSDPAKSRLTASKHIILFCDGMMTEGDDPVAIATAARSANIRVSTIAFGSQADTNLMRAIATAGGGSFYTANSETELQSVFRQIAQTLPSVLTK